MMQSNDPSRKSTYLLLVNELGEFTELLQVANSLKTRGNVKCVFLFAREHYTAFAAHSAISKSQGHEAISMSYEGLLRLDWENKLSEQSMNGNIPESILRKRFRLFSWLSSPVLFLYTALYFMLLAVLSPVILIGFLFVIVRRLFRRASPRYTKYIKYISPLLLVPVSYLRYARWRHHSRVLVKIIQPDMIVMGQYYAGSYNAVIAHTHKKIPSIVVPFAMGTAREVAESLYRRSDYHLPPGMLSYLIHKLYPTWVNTYKGKKLIRLAIDEIIVLHFMGFRENQPWVPNCGPATLLCLSQENLDYYKRVGMPPEKLHNAGGLWNDFISAAMQHRKDDIHALEGVLRSIRANHFQQKISGQIGFKVPQLDLRNMNSKNLPLALKGCEEIITRNHTIIEQMTSEVENNPRLKKQRNAIEVSRVRAHASSEARKFRKGKHHRIVISWPTNQYPQPAWSFESYKEYSDYLIEFLGRIHSYWNVEILVSLHPTLLNILSKKDFEDNGLTLISWPLLDYIHTADIFIANVSSTIFWAVQCSIPTINFDTYRYGYEEFKDAGCESVEVPRDFEKILVRLLSDAEFYAEVKERIESTKAYWTHPEGGSLDRILQKLSH